MLRRSALGTCMGLKWVVYDASTWPPIRQTSQLWLWMPPHSPALLQVGLAALQCCQQPSSYFVQACREGLPHVLACAQKAFSLNLENWAYPSKAGICSSGFAWLDASDTSQLCFRLALQHRYVLCAVSSVKGTKGGLMSWIGTLKLPRHLQHLTSFRSAASAPFVAFHDLCTIFCLFSVPARRTRLCMQVLG